MTAYKCSADNKCNDNQQAEPDREKKAEKILLKIRKQGGKRPVRGKLCCKKVI